MGEYRTVLEDRHDQLSDPADGAANPDVNRVASLLREALDSGRPIWIPRLGGLEIPLKGILSAVGLTDVELSHHRPADAVAITPPRLPPPVPTLWLSRQGDGLRLGRHLGCHARAMASAWPVPR